MASVTTTTISQASQVLNPRIVQSNQPAREHGLEITRDSQKISQLSQAAGNNSKSMGASSSRGTQIPSRSEGSFHERNHKGSEEGKSESFNDKPSGNKLNLKV